MEEKVSSVDKLSTHLNLFDNEAKTIEEFNIEDSNNSNVIKVDSEDKHLPKFHETVGEVSESAITEGNLYEKHVDLNILDNLSIMSTKGDVAVKAREAHDIIEESEANLTILDNVNKNTSSPTKENLNILQLKGNDYEKKTDDLDICDKDSQGSVSGKENTPNSFSDKNQLETKLLNVSSLPNESSDPSHSDIKCHQVMLPKIDLVRTEKNVGLIEELEDKPDCLIELKQKSLPEIRIILKRLPETSTFNELSKLNDVDRPNIKIKADANIRKELSKKDGGYTKRGRRKRKANLARRVMTRRRISELDSPKSNVQSNINERVVKNLDKFEPSELISVTATNINEDVIIPSLMQAELKETIQNLPACNTEHLDEIKRLALLDQSKNIGQSQCKQVIDSEDDIILTSSIPKKLLEPVDKLAVKIVEPSNKITLLDEEMNIVEEVALSGYEEDIVKAKQEGSLENVVDSPISKVEQQEEMAAIEISGIDEEIVKPKQFIDSDSLKDKIITSSTQNKKQESFYNLVFGKSEQQKEITAAEFSEQSTKVLDMESEISKYENLLVSGSKKIIIPSSNQIELQNVLNTEMQEEMAMVKTMEHSNKIDAMEEEISKCGKILHDSDRPNIIIPMLKHELQKTTHNLSFRKSELPEDRAKEDLTDQLNEISFIEEEISKQQNIHTDLGDAPISLSKQVKHVKKVGLEILDKDISKPDCITVSDSEDKIISLPKLEELPYIGKSQLQDEMSKVEIREQSNKISAIEEEISKSENILYDSDCIFVPVLTQKLQEPAHNLAFGKSELQEERTKEDLTDQLKEISSIEKEISNQENILSESGDVIIPLSNQQEHVDGIAVDKVGLEVKMVKERGLDEISILDKDISKQDCTTVSDSEDKIISLPKPEESPYIRKSQLQDEISKVEIKELSSEISAIEEVTSKCDNILCDSDDIFIPVLTQKLKEPVHNLAFGKSELQEEMAKDDLTDQSKKISCIEEEISKQENILSESGDVIIPLSNQDEPTEYVDCIVVEKVGLKVKMVKEGGLDEISILDKDISKQDCITVSDPEDKITSLPKPEEPPYIRKSQLQDEISKVEIKEQSSEISAIEEVTSKCDNILYDSDDIFIPVLTQKLQEPFHNLAFGKSELQEERAKEDLTNQSKEISSCIEEEITNQENILTDSGDAIIPLSNQDEPTEYVDCIVVEKVGLEVKMEKERSLDEISNLDKDISKQECIAVSYSEDKITSLSKPEEPPYTRKSQLQDEITKVEIKEQSSEISAIEEVTSKCDNILYDSDDIFIPVLTQKLQEPALNLAFGKSELQEERAREDLTDQLNESYCSIEEEITKQENILTDSGDAIIPLSKQEEHTEYVEKVCFNVKIIKEESLNKISVLDKDKSKPECITVSDSEDIIILLPKPEELPSIRNAQLQEEFTNVEIMEKGSRQKLQEPVNNLVVRKSELSEERAKEDLYEQLIRISVADEELSKQENILIDSEDKIVDSSQQVFQKVQKPADNKVVGKTDLQNEMVKQSILEQQNEVLVIDEEINKHKPVIVSDSENEKNIKSQKIEENLPLGNVGHLEKTGECEVKELSHCISNCNKDLSNVNEVMDSTKYKDKINIPKHVTVSDNESNIVSASLKASEIERNHDSLLDLVSQSTTSQPLTDSKITRQEKIVISKIIGNKEISTEKGALTILVDGHGTDKVGNTEGVENTGKIINYISSTDKGVIAQNVAQLQDKKSEKETKTSKKKQNLKVDEKFNSKTAKEKTEAKKDITLISFDGLAKSKIGFFTEKTGTDQQYGSFKRIVIIGDSYIDMLSTKWPVESRIKPYFLSADNLSIFKFNQKVMEHPFFHNCDGKILIVAIIGMSDIFSIDYVKSGNCPVTHPPHKIMGRPFGPTYPNNDDPYAFANVMSKNKIQLESELENVYMVYSYFPIVNIVSVGVKMLIESKTKLRKCTCSYSLTSIENKRLYRENASVIKTLNQLIFTNKMTQLPNKIFFNFTPLLIEYDIKIKNWTTIADDSTVLNAIELENSLHLVLHGVKSKIKNLHDATSTKIPPLDPNLTSAEDEVNVYVIGDSWLKGVFQIWEQEASIKPKFYFDAHMNLFKLKKLILSLSTNESKNTLIITSVCFDDLVKYKSYPGCSDHEPLLFPVPKIKVDKKPISFTTEIQNIITEIENEIYKRRKNLKIIYMTCYPLMFENFFYKCLSEAHELETHHAIDDRLVENNDSTYYTECVEVCVKRLNKFLVNKNLDIHSHTCDIHSLINKLAKVDKFIIMPVFISDKSPSTLLAEKLYMLMKEYMDSMNELFKKNKFSFENSTFDESLEDIRCYPEEDDEEEVYPHKVINLKIKVKMDDDSRKVTAFVSELKENCDIITSSLPISSTLPKVTDKPKDDLKRSQKAGGDKKSNKKRTRELITKDLKVNTDSDIQVQSLTSEQDKEEKSAVTSYLKETKEVQETNHGGDPHSVSSQIREARRSAYLFSKFDNDGSQRIQSLDKARDRRHSPLRHSKTYNNEVQNRLHYGNYSFRSNWEGHRPMPYYSFHDKPFFTSRGRRTRSRSKERRSRSRSKGRRSRSRSKGRRSRSRSRGHRARSRSKRHRSRSRSKGHRSRSRSKGHRSSSKSKTYRTRSRSKTNRSRSRSKTYRTRSRSKNHGSRSRSKSHNRLSSRKKDYRSRSKSKDYRSRLGTKVLRSEKECIKLRKKHSRSRSSSRSHSSQMEEKSKKYSTSSECNTSLSKSRSNRSTEEEALKDLWEIHERECNMYRANPSAHPDYSRLKRMWIDVMISQGVNPHPHSLEPEWEAYWLRKIEIIFNESWEEKKSQCLSLLAPPVTQVVSSESSTSDSSSSDHSSHRKKSKYKKKKSKDKKSKTSKKKLKRESQEADEPLIKKSKANESLGSNSISSLAHEIKDAKLLSLEDLEAKIQDFMAKSQGNFVEKINIKKDNSPPPPVEHSLAMKLLDVTTVLSQLSDKFGALGLSVKVLHEKISHAIAVKEDPLVYIDDDAKVLLGLIKDKLKRCMEGQSLTLVQRAIIQEALDRLTPFLSEMESDKPYFGLDLNVIAQVTEGKSIFEIVTFIENALAYKKILNVSQDELMKIYLAIKDLQIKSLNVSPKSSNFPSTSKYSQIANSNKPGKQQNMTHIQKEIEKSFKPAMNPSQNIPNLLAKTSQIPNYGITYKTERASQIRQSFLSLPMNEKIRKFSNFDSLPFEEKSFMLTHLDELEKSDKKLACSLRWMISQNRGGFPEK